MQLGQRYVKKEWFWIGRMRSNEVATATGELRIDAPTHFQVVGFAESRRLPCAALHDVRDVDHRGIETDRLGEHGFIRGAGDAVPLVEASVLRVTTLAIAQMPLTVHRRRVARTAERFGQGQFPGVNPLGQACGYRLQSAGTDGMTPRHQRRAGRYAVALDIEVQEPSALRCQRIDAGRRRPSEGPSAITAQLPPAEVIGQHQNNMGAATGCGGFEGFSRFGRVGHDQSFRFSVGTSSSQLSTSAFRNRSNST